MGVDFSSEIKDFKDIGMTMLELFCNQKKVTLKISYKNGTRPKGLSGNSKYFSKKQFQIMKIVPRIDRYSILLYFLYETKRTLKPNPEENFFIMGTLQSDLWK